MVLDQVSRIHALYICVCCFSSFSSVVATEANSRAFFTAIVTQIKLVFVF